MASDVEVVGLAEVQKDLRALQEKVTKKHLVKYIRPGANIISKEVKAQSPVRTGTLRDSITLQVGKGKDTDPYAKISTYFKKNYVARGKKVYPFYVKFVHDGTVTHPGKRKHRKPRLYSRSEERAWQRQRMAEGRVRIKPNDFIYRAFDAKVDEAAKVILDNIAKATEL